MPPSHINSNNVSVESVHAVTFCGSSGCRLGRLRSVFPASSTSLCYPPPVPACQRGRPVSTQIGMGMRAMKIGRMISGLIVLRKPILIVVANGKAPSVAHAVTLLMMKRDK